MYFPYLRGKQFEQLAIERAGFLTDLTVPVFEPTQLEQAYRRRYERMAVAGRRFALITNSANGRPAPQYAEGVAAIQAIDAAAQGQVMPALEIRPNTTPGEVQRFADDFSDRQTVLVHRAHVHDMATLTRVLAPLGPEPIHVVSSPAVEPVARALPGTRYVLLRDGFDRQPTNRDYPPRTGFDNLVFSYRGLGYDGFGDFSVIGDHYASGGGQAYTVTLHLTEVSDGPTIVTNHFVSDPPAAPGNPQRKYFNALDKLVAYTQSPPTPPFATQGVGGYHDSHRQRRYRGLGLPKGWSILHHLAIIERELAAAGAQAWI